VAVDARIVIDHAPSAPGRYDHLSIPPFIGHSRSCAVG